MDHLSPIFVTILALAKDPAAGLCPPEQIQGDTAIVRPVHRHPPHYIHVPEGLSAVTSQTGMMVFKRWSDGYTMPVPPWFNPTL